MLRFSKWFYRIILCTFELYKLGNLWIHLQNMRFLDQEVGQQPL